MFTYFILFWAAIEKGTAHYLSYLWIWRIKKALTPLLETGALYSTFSVYLSKNSFVLVQIPQLLKDRGMTSTKMNFFLMGFFGVKNP